MEEENIIDLIIIALVKEFNGLNNEKELKTLEEKYHIKVM